MTYAVYEQVWQVRVFHLLKGTEEIAGSYPTEDMAKTGSADYESPNSLVSIHLYLKLCRVGTARSCIDYLEQVQ